MDIKIISIIKQVIGENIYYLGRDKKNHIYLLNRYSQSKNILQSLPKFKQASRVKSSSTKLVSAKVKSKGLLVIVKLY